MVVPVALAQLVARSFAQTVLVACVTGLVASALWDHGLLLRRHPVGRARSCCSRWLAFGVTALGTVGLARVRAARHRRRHGTPEQHGDHVHHGEHVHGEDGCEHPVVRHHGHVDYVHDGHRHAPRLTRHGVGYDEH